MENDTGEANTLILMDVYMRVNSKRKGLKVGVNIRFLRVANMKADFQII
jgi:hypothetical protein